MDYLNILATRSLILFKPSSANTTPTQSSTTSTLIPPTPVPVPIESIISANNHIAYFLIQHVLNSQPNSSESAVSTVPKAVVAEAEIMVWKELAQGQKFVLALGQALARGKMSEQELKALAKEFGLKLKKEDNGVDCHSEYHSRHAGWEAESRGGGEGVMA